MSSADRRIAALWLGMLVFFVYGSWAPLALQARPLADAWSAFMALPGPQLAQQSRTDLAVNFLLLVPLAFGAMHLLRPRLGAAALLLVLPALALLSVAVEFVQVFLPSRSPSWSDVVLQWAGNAVGVALQLLFGERARQWLQGLAAGMPTHERLLRWLGLYAAALLVWQMMPLDLSISPVELYRKWRDGRVVLLPFSVLPTGAWDRFYELSTDILLWSPLGLLWALARPTAPLRQLLARAAGWVAAVELAQLFVLSRVSDVTDVLLGTLGVGLGVMLARALPGWRTWPVQRQRGALNAALAVWLAGSLVVLWQPFALDLSRATPAAVAELFTRLPFATYFGRGEFGALAELLHKLLVFLPGGLLLAARARAHGGPLGISGISGIAAGAGARAIAALAAWATLLELGQLVMDGKVADLTDLALGVLGGWVGWRIGLSLQGELSAEVPAALPQARRERALEQVRAVPATVRAAPAEAPVPHWRWRFPAALLGLALLLWLAARAPGMPYNLAKLMPAGPAGLLAAVGVALALAWVLALPTLLMHVPRRPWRLAFVPLLLLHGLATFVLLRSAVPLPMLHKVIGTPVLGWGPAAVLEDAGRYIALHLALMLPLLGAMWLVRVFTHARALPDLAWWAACALLLLAPVQGVVVVAAGTDNLVELMRGGGSLRASLALAAGWGAWATAGIALAALGAGGPWPRRRLGVLAALALLLAPTLLWLGLEPQLFKYGQFFSAAQFLLSAGRDAYASGSALALRAAVAVLAGLLLVAALQLPGWRVLAREAPARGRRPAR
jgi:glycopeptide antibiotics resistance protein